MSEPLDSVFQSQWVVFALPAVLLVGFAELGFRLGLRLYVATDTARKGEISGIQGALLGLLGLLLGFTFAMAVSRYQARRDLVVKEANAIGTTFLRASLLPEAHQAPGTEAPSIPRFSRTCSAATLRRVSRSNRWPLTP